MAKINARKGIFLLLPVLIGFGSYLFAKYLYSNPPRSTVRFPEEIDLGSVRIGYQFVPVEIHNDGNNPLELSLAQVSCGCLVVAESESPTSESVKEATISPGKSKRFYAQVFIRDHPTKQFRTTFSFQTNDPTLPRIQIGITARIRGGISAEPTQIILPSGVPGTIVEQKIALRDHEFSPPRKIDRILSSNPDRVQIVDYREAQDADRLAEGDERLIGQVRIAIRLPDQGELSEKIEIFDSSLNEPLLAVPIQGNVVHPFSFSPSTISLPRRVEDRLSWSARLICRSSNREPFTIQVLDSGELEVNLKAGNHSSFTFVDVTCPPKSIPKSGSVTGKLKFQIAQNGKSSEHIVLFSILSQEAFE